MSAHDRALELVEALKAVEVPATADPRSATPPCVLVTPPDRTYDLACGYSARWRLWAIAPGPGNADAWRALDGLVDAVAGAFPVEVAVFSSYVLTPDAPAMPAYRIELTEGVP